MDYFPNLNLGLVGGSFMVFIQNLINYSSFFILWSSESFLEFEVYLDSSELDIRIYDSNFFLCFTYQIHSLIFLNSLS